MPNEWSYYASQGCVPDEGHSEKPHGGAESGPELQWWVGLGRTEGRGKDANSLLFLYVFVTEKTMWVLFGVTFLNNISWNTLGKNVLLFSCLLGYAKAVSHQ